MSTGDRAPSPPPPSSEPWVDAAPSPPSRPIFHDEFIAPPPSPPSPSPPPPSPSILETPHLPGSSPPPPFRSTGRESPRTPFSTPGFSPSPSSSSSGGLSTGVVVGIAIGGGIAVLVILTLICLLCKKNGRKDDEATKAGGSYGGRQQQNAKRPSDHVVTSLPPPSMSSNNGSSGSNYSDPPELVLGYSKGIFTYAELDMATNGFSDENLLGQGGFGYVYKGLLTNGKEIAVKQLKAGSCQGEREFQAEIKSISRIRHRHLVSLVGYCMAGAQRLLVYEFLPNNTLEFHLRGKGRPPMEWSLRLKIAIGSAKGLSFLHEICNPKIIHRDIKTANILIDSQFEAKVADFGLAKIASDANTHVSTRVMGTFGYLAPEYAGSGKLTEKSDVYSFGVVLLELITGHCPVDAINAYGEDSLVDWARPLLQQALENNDFDGLADPKLNNEYDKEEMARMVACAAACVQHSARSRPRMDQVECALEGNIWPSDPNKGIRPEHSNVNSSYHKYGL